MDLKARNIRVNVLSPGTIDTPILQPLGTEAIDQFVSLIPRGTIERPEEIATAALFLASSDSSFVTGVELYVDGGTAQILSTQLRMEKDIVELGGKLAIVTGGLKKAFG
jgi:NAD(P)-dependent dehydrogenase (short-subunit alcohol dehydrogenase family)